MVIRSNNKKIQLQQKIISQLEEENKYLKEQLNECNKNGLIKKAHLSDEGYIGYLEIVNELNELKNEYQRLIKLVKTDRKNKKKM